MELCELSEEEYQEIVCFNKGYNKSTDILEIEHSKTFYDSYFNSDAYNYVYNRLKHAKSVYGMMSYLTDLEIIRVLKGLKTSILTNDIAEYTQKQQQTLLGSGMYFEFFEGRNSEIAYKTYDFVYNDFNYSMMHNKFLIIDDSILITGSMNLSGYYNSLDNIIVTNDRELIYRYEKQYYNFCFGTNPP